jgi:hypothetical protein
VITKKTVFIVGAGASCIYGLPTGESLLEKAKTLKPGTPLYSLLTEDSPEDEHWVLEVLTDLREHGASSIDAYLQTRRHEAQVQRMGRRLIAVLMAQELDGSTLPSRDQDWLQYLFQQMFDGAEDSFEAFSENLVTIVTFNFDTFIEDRFASLLGRTYRDFRPGFPPVIHVHGQLPPLATPIRIDTRRGSQFRPELLSWIDRAASEIRVVFDDLDENVVKSAKDVVSKATIHCFLGFAYGQSNLTRLGLPIRPSDPILGSTIQAFGSAYGMESGERTRVRSRMEITLADQADDCRSALRKLNVFL